MLSAHLQTKASGTQLRQRVNELLKQPDAATQADESHVEGFEDLEDFDPYEPTRLFWEQIKQLGFAFREIRREDVTDNEVEELLKVSEPIMAVLSRIQRRKEQRGVTKFGTLLKIKSCLKKVALVNQETNNSMINEGVEPMLRSGHFSSNVGILSFV